MLNLLRNWCLMEICIISYFLQPLQYTALHEMRLVDFKYQPFVSFIDVSGIPYWWNWNTVSPINIYQTCLCVDGNILDLWVVSKILHLSYKLMQIMIIASTEKLNIKIMNLFDSDLVQVYNKKNACNILDTEVRVDQWCNIIGSI